ncbi:MAG: hypothetical protein RL108_475 [Bacteroidota bacterium]
MRYKLQVECSLEIKEQLQLAALKKFGKANASMMVRYLISNELKNNDPTDDLDNSENARVQISIPKKMLDKINELSESRSTSRVDVFKVMINDYFKKAPLLGDELNELRKSNYELSKLGTNLNQITKVINTGGYLSKEFSEEATKKINSIRPEIRKHIDLVLNIIHNKGISFEIKKGGNRKIKITKKE